MQSADSCNSFFRQSRKFAVCKTADAVALTQLPFHKAHVYLVLRYKKGRYLEPEPMR